MMPSHEAPLERWLSLIGPSELAYGLPPPGIPGEINPVPGGLEMAQNSNYLEKSKKLIVNHIQRVIKCGNFSAYLNIKFVNKQHFNFLSKI
jgi:hypothetical protein